MRLCPGCGCDLTNTHGNRRRCPPCKVIFHRRVEYDKNRLDRVPMGAIVAYMEDHAPQALGLIKTKIVAARAAERQALAAFNQTVGDNI